MNLDIKLKFNFNKRNPNCVFNNYFCHGLLCNIVVLKVIKDEEMRNNK